MSGPLAGPALEAAAILLAILTGASLSALEAALTALGEVRLIDAAEAGGRLGHTAARIRAEGPRMHARLLTGRVTAIVVAVGLTVYLASPLGPWWVTGLSLAVLALLYTTLAVGLGAVARTLAPRWALPMAWALHPVELLFWPIAAPLGLMVGLVDRRITAPVPTRLSEEAVREVEHMIEKREEAGAIPEEFAELLLSVLEFKDTVAREVMVPRTEMVAIEISTAIDDVLDLMVREGHSRYPVYRERVDQIEGILYAKDVFRMMRDREKHSLARIIRRPVYFVAETHKIGQLLREMQQRRFHLAIVVDEYGGTAGIVTLEDILEEIVGEIHDEHDTEEAQIEEIAPGRWWVDASVSIYDLAEALSADLNEEGAYDSLGGMISDRAGHVPQVGESLKVDGFEFIVREGDERRVTRVEVRRAGDSSVHDAAE